MQLSQQLSRSTRYTCCTTAATGGSGGKPSERAIHADSLALFQEVHEQHPDIAVIGRSLAAVLPFIWRAKRPCPGYCWSHRMTALKKLRATEYPYVPVRWLLLDRYESGKYAPRIRIPTTLIAAENDEVIPRASTEKLLAPISGGHSLDDRHKGCWAQ